MRVAICGDGDRVSLLGYRAPLLTGERGTAQTVRVMRQLVDEAQADPEFVRFAIDLVRNVPEYDELGEVSALYSWVLGNIRYTKDPINKEKLYPPKETLRIGAGDCDDMATLLAALTAAIGYRSRLVTIGADPDYPQDFSHVYAEVEAPAGSENWIPLDAARPGAAFGVEAPAWTRKRTWSLTDDGYSDVRGVRGLAGLGQDSNQILSQVLSETPQIIAATAGQPTSYTINPQTGLVSTTTGSPYASFMTPYTPGYAVPAAGYGTLNSVQYASSSLFSSLLPWLLIGGLVLVAVKR